MRIQFYFVGLVLVTSLTFACKKTPTNTTNSTAFNQPAKSVNCTTTSSTEISFTATVKPMVLNSCGNCHSKPGAGGILLDNYTTIKNLALTGDLISVITNTNPGTIMMPPPPNPHLDSCQIKSISVWINEGCLNN